MRSPELEECRICHRYRYLEPHHLLPGTGKRKLADEDGIVWMICRECHDSLHFSKDDEWIRKSKELLQEGERMWLRKTGGTIAQFRRRYGKNYLDEEETYVQEEGQDPDYDRER